MTLRNAFADLGTEYTLRKILRAVSFARDGADRLYVSISNQPPVTLQAGNANTPLGSQFQTPYSQNAWNLHDIRAEYQESTHQSFQATRNRWTIT